MAWKYLKLKKKNICSAHLRNGFAGINEMRQFNSLALAQEIHLAAFMYVCVFVLACSSVRMDVSNRTFRYFFQISLIDNNELFYCKYFHAIE